MPVLGVNVTKVEFEKKGIAAPPDRIEVNITPKIKDLRLGKANLPSGDLEGIEVLFRYEINYRPDIAEGYVDGIVLYLPAREDANLIIDEWEVSKKVDGELVGEVLNFLTMELAPVIMVIAKEMRIPYHLPLPRFEVQGLPQFSGPR